MKIYLIGLFYGSISPGYFGQLMRVPYLKEKTGEPFGKLFINTVIETFVHTFSLYGMMIIGALLVVGTLPELLPITIAWILCFTFIAAYFVKRERGEKLLRILISYIIPKKVKYHFSAFVDTFYIDFPRFKAMIIPYVLGIIHLDNRVFTGIYDFIGIGTSDPVFCIPLTVPDCERSGFYSDYVCWVRNKGVYRYFYFYDAFPSGRGTDSGVVACWFYRY